MPALSRLTVYPEPAQPLKAKPSNKKAVAKAIARFPVKIAKLAAQNPNVVTNIAFPLALTTFSAPVIASLPLGPLGPLLACVAVACGRFQLRGELMGGGYALMHAIGVASVKGQAVSLLGLVGLEALGIGRLRDTMIATMFETNIGPRAQVLGLAVAAVTSATGMFGSLGSMLGARSMGLLFGELKSFAAYMGLKWAVSNLKEMWASLVAAGVEVKVAFLRWAARHNFDGEEIKGVTKELKGAAKELNWVRDYLKKLAKHMPGFPVGALSPELAHMLEAWDDMKEKEAAEPLTEWTIVDVDENEKHESTIVWEADEEAFDEWLKVDAEDGKVSTSIVWAAHPSIELETVNATTVAAEAVAQDTGAWDVEPEEVADDDNDVDDIPEIEDLDYMVWRVGSQH